jgi:hypothetical protein
MVFIHLYQPTPTIYFSVSTGKPTLIERGEKTEKITPTTVLPKKYNKEWSQ